MKSLEIIVESRTDTILNLIASGSIDEHAVYPTLDFQNCTSVNFDMSQVDLINSTGIQNWIGFFESIPDTMKIVFSKCNVRVVNQLNQFPGFLAGKKVSFSSFFAPYFCESCDRALEILIEKESFGDTIEKGLAPEAFCSCEGASALEFDSIEKKYFKFYLEAEDK